MCEQSLSNCIIFYIIFFSIECRKSFFSKFCVQKVTKLCSKLKIEKKTISFFFSFFLFSNFWAFLRGVHLVRSCLTNVNLVFSSKKIKIFDFSLRGGDLREHAWQFFFFSKKCTKKVTKLFSKRQKCRKRWEIIFFFFRFLFFF